MNQIIREETFKSSLIPLKTNYLSVKLINSKHNTQIEMLE